MLSIDEEAYLKAKIAKEKALVNLETKQKSKQDALKEAQAVIDLAHDADITAAELAYNEAKDALEIELNKEK